METLTMVNIDSKTIFARQQRTALRIKQTSAAERIVRLLKLKQVVI